MIPARFVLLEFKMSHPSNMYSAIELLRQDFYKDCGETELGVTSICLRPFDPSTYPRRRLQDERNCAGPIQADEIDISNLIDSLPSFFSQ